jgi:soluble lytic murein transglycosylase-like protein
MAVQTKTIRKSRAAASRATRKETVKSSFLRLIPGWIVIALVLVILLPNALSATLGATGRMITALPPSIGVAYTDSPIAPLFTSTIDYWSGNISRWAAQYNLDPNLLATVMQIESCGDDRVSSSAGAQGLFQVMPFHFSPGENYLDPDTNAMRGANFLNECLRWANGDSGLAMACYNGGPSVVNRPFASWANETQRYYVWGTTIYGDARQNKTDSDSLAAWLNAGGSNLCRRAANTLGISG